MDKPKVTIYTDGGAMPNPGAGGWGAVLIFDKDGSEHKRELSGGANDTTNNRMELTAAIEALQALKQPCQIEFYTDSQYVKKGINEWMENWQRTNFKNNTIQNVDLWVVLDREVRKHEINWHWVKGHAGNYYNEIVDKLATAGRAPFVTGTTLQAEEAAPDDPNVMRAYLAVSCLGTPGVGAWAVLLQQGDDSRMLTGGLPSTNVGRLDLLSAVAALEAVPAGSSIKVYTGSSYLRDGITQWIQGWKKSGWQKKTGGEVQYSDLWKKLDQLAQARKVQWVLVKSDARPLAMDALTQPLKETIEQMKKSK
jgi:ribonuclease HI